MLDTTSSGSRSGRYVDKIKFEACRPFLMHQPSSCTSFESAFSIARAKLVTSPCSMGVLCAGWKISLPPKPF